MKKVVVTAHPKTGAIFTKAVNADGSSKLDKNGKEHGFIRVEQRELSLGFVYNNGGVKRRSALIAMTVEAWSKSAVMIKDGTEVPGTIVRHNSIKEFYKGQKPLQTAEGKTITANGLPVYRNEFYTESKALIEAGDKNLDFEAFDRVAEAVESKTQIAE